MTEFSAENVDAGNDYGRYEQEVTQTLYLVQTVLAICTFITLLAAWQLYRIARSQLFVCAVWEPLNNGVFTTTHSFLNDVVCFWRGTILKLRTANKPQRKTE